MFSDEQLRSVQGHRHVLCWCEEIKLIWGGERKLSNRKHETEFLNHHIRCIPSIKKTNAFEKNIITLLL